MKRIGIVRVVLLGGFLGVIVSTPALARHDAEPQAPRVPAARIAADIAGADSAPVDSHVCPGFKSE